MIMGRYDSSVIESGKSLPNEWHENFVKVLTAVYEKKSNEDNCFFDVYGQMYKEEFLIIVSYIHKEDYSKSPITLFLSHDILDSSDKFKSALETVIDLSGMIFDDIFSTEYWNNYIQHWTENKIEGHCFHYKITRENISLTLQAEALLNNEKASE